mmetsp:Transcript_29607/g.77669  ORF Transcript_29607/g.77669 Transcript_29607/m.77669 type:complete len:252 (-) Transcript_29607:35-790(-)
MLGDLRQRRKHLTLQLGVRVLHQNCQVRNGPCVDDRLGELGGVLADVRQRRRTDPLERDLRLLDAVHQEVDCTSINHCRGKLGIVSPNVPQCPRSRFLHAWVEFFKAHNKRLDCARVHHSLRELRTVLCHGAENKCSGLLVEAVVFGERVDKLWQDVALDDGTSEILVCVGESAKGNGCSVLHRRDGVKEERAEKCHHPCFLKGLGVLLPCCHLGDRLHKRSSCLLVLLKHLRDLSLRHRCGSPMQPAVCC